MSCIFACGRGTGFWLGIAFRKASAALQLRRRGLLSRTVGTGLDDIFAVENTGVETVVLSKGALEGQDGVDVDCVCHIGF